MIQDISPYTLDNHYKNISPDPKSKVLFIKDNSLLLKIHEGTIEFPCFEQMADCEIDMIYLFSISGQIFFLANANEAQYCQVSQKLAMVGYALHGIKSMTARKPKWLSFAAMVGYQIGKWYDGNKYCGKCGNKLYPSQNERAMCCQACGNIIYPKICPVVIVAVVNGDRVLLTKYADRGHYDKYALVAGFTEVGETIEETVQREVMEETGVKVKNIRYYKCQPWPFSDSLLFGFFCDLDGSDEIVMDPGELSVAQWVCRDEMQVEKEDISLTNEMMVKFKNGLEVN
ncbi:MAG: NAD(+) diphosphatase [Clostridiales bacterium]|nr:NAD(+) diphosphatase [Clostridiales bacterium]